MASIGRWLYRLFSICLPCLKSAETDEKDSKDHPPDLNSFENDRDGNTSLKNKYPDDLNPFASDEENENSIGKAEKEQREDEYPDTFNPFAIDDEGNKYPEELNPFADEEDGEADSAMEQREDEYPDTLNPFAIDDEGNKYPEELNPFADEEDGEADAAMEQREDEYPDTLNPFAIDDEGNEEQIEYPEELNPFADEDDGEADSAIINQSSLALDRELTPSDKKGSSATVPLLDEENTDRTDESEKKGNEYPEWLNPFASADEENERGTDYLYGSVLSSYKVIEYDEALNPFASEDVENKDSIVKNPSMTVDPQLSTVAVNGSSSSLVSLANERRKRKSTKKYRAPGPPITMSIIPNESAPGLNESSPGVKESAPGVKESAPGVHESDPGVKESAPGVKESAPGVKESAPGVKESAPGDSEILGPVPLKVKVDDYDESLNPFASEDEEIAGDTTGNLPSSPEQPIAVAAYSCTSVNVKEKAKSSKKRRAPDPPVIESTGDIIANQPCASSSNPSTKESEE